ncbi:hypothetical protein PV04_08964 [Phialophora macrospora]|uniref:Uncharacterized protein n=1 Tax=Phialophora macrospora TaxID=1851006 RepID=A0A0D2FVJ1_9EURO|nr:hypothetical protein PV04_08964 [Phialophora macrospora]
MSNPTSSNSVQTPTDNPATTSSESVRRETTTASSAQGSTNSASHSEPRAETTQPNLTSMWDQSMEVDFFGDRKIGEETK